jgi:RHS repeat-associated protein
VFATLVHNGDGTWTFQARKNLTYTFSSAGKLTSIRDRNGYTTALTYTSGNLTKITDPAGRTLTFTYDTSNRVKTVKDGLPRTVTYGYDPAGNLSSVVDADGRTWTYGYDPAHRLTTDQDPRLNTVTSVYDATGRVTSQIDRRNKTTQIDYGTLGPNRAHTTTVTHPRGNKDSYSYQDGRLTSEVHGIGTPDAATTAYGYDNATNQVAAVTDPLNHTSSYAYDLEGNLLSSTDPLGQTTITTYNAFGEPLTVNDPLHVTTTNTYDTAGNLLSTSRPLVGSSPAQSATQTLTYGDSAHPGDVTATTDARAKLTHYSYDTYGNLASSTDPTNRKTTYTHNIAGWVTSTVSPAGNASGGHANQHTTSYSNFTGFGQPKTITDPLGKATTMGYDADQNLTDVTDPDLRHTMTAYDADGNPTLITRPDTTTQASGYDDNGNLATQTDGRNKATSYGYDALDRVRTVTDPLARVSTTTYDLAGNTATVTQPGVGTGTLTTTYGYDAGHQLKTIDYSDGSTHSVAYTYDGDGRRTGMTDATGTTSYTLDSLGRPTQVTDGANDSVGYGYDLAGNTTSISYPAGLGSVTRGFDDAGRLTSVTDWLTHASSFHYDNDGNLDTLTYPNTVTGTNTFDNADRLLTITYAKGNTTLGKYTYSHTGAGLLASATPSAGAPGTASTYAYDSNARLQATAGPSSPAKWVYDAADRVSTQPDGSTLAYDDANQLATTTPTSGPATSYAYDNRGNRTSSTVGTATPTNYGYDQANDLTTINNPTGTWTYTYDGNGVRVSRQLGVGTKTPFTWDPVSSLLLRDGTSAYIYGPGNAPIEQVRSGTASYLHGDQLASTVLITNQAGAVADTYAYDPYGRVTTHTGTTTTQLQFNGQYTDPESGLVYLRARFYDPQTGQFLTRDPAESATRQAYTYTADDPLNRADPSGLWWSWAVQHLDPLYPVIGLYAKEVDAYNGGCGFWRSFGYGVEATALGATEAITAEVGGEAVAAVGGRLLARLGRSAAARASQETVQLFRSVDSAEFNSIAATRGFSTAPGQMEGKFFATTGEHAEHWGQLLHGGDALTVETRIPRLLADQLFLREGKLDGVGPAIYANGEQVNLINAVMDGIRVWP